MSDRERMNNLWGSLLTWALFLAFFALVIHDDRIGATGRKIETTTDDTTIEYLDHLYEDYNRTYFDNKLPVKVRISFNEHDPDNAASIECDEQGQNCDIMFNPHYNAAPRYAALNLQHEMCHIEVWVKDGPDHGKEWQTCMLRIDAMGSNRLVLIDGWTGN